MRDRHLVRGEDRLPAAPLLSKHRNVEFVTAEVAGLDPAGRRVLARRLLGEQVEFGYDYLILAADVRQSYFGHDEYARFALGMKTIEDAMKIRRRIFGAFELDLEMLHDHPHYPGFLEYGLSTVILAGDKGRPDTGTAARETTARPKWRP